MPPSLPRVARVILPQKTQGRSMLRPCGEFVADDG
jgi:hypothetical protein